MKLHKLTIVALFIWLANSIYSIKLSKAFRPYAIAIFFFLVIFTFQSCASGCQQRKKKYFKRYVQIETTYNFELV